MAAPEILLSDEQRLEFTQISQHISEWEIAKYYTFTENDMDIINRHRRDYNRLGFAVQLCCLRNPGWSLGNVSGIPDTVLNYIAEQLKVSPKNFELYAQRENLGSNTFRSCGRNTVIGILQIPKVTTFMNALCHMLWRMIMQEGL